MGLNLLELATSEINVLTERRAPQFVVDEVRAELGILAQLDFKLHHQSDCFHHPKSYQYEPPFFLFIRIVFRSHHCLQQQKRI